MSLFDTFTAEELRELVTELAEHNAAAVASRSSQTPPNGADDEPTTSPGRRGIPDKYILLVEDDRDIGMTLTDILEEEGYYVVWKENGVDALRFLEIDFMQSQREALLEAFVTERPVEPRTPALVLLDLMLPVVNGVEVQEVIEGKLVTVRRDLAINGRDVFRKMKENEATRNIPVVVMSAEPRLRDVYRDDLVSIEGVLMGPERALKKPLALRTFLDEVHRLAGPPPPKKGAHG